MPDLLMECLGFATASPSLPGVSLDRHGLMEGLTWDKVSISKLLQLLLHQNNYNCYIVILHFPVDTCLLLQNNYVDQVVLTIMAVGHGGPTWFDYPK